MARKISRSEATQARIIAVAYQVFAREGFAHASLAEIVMKAEVTTGAVYHHFGDKKGLFRAVAEHVEQEIVKEVAKLPPVEDPWTAFENGVAATLQICARPAVQRIVFQEAPTVIGLAEWRKIEVQYAFGDMRTAIGNLHEAGIIDAPDVELTAQIVLGIIIQAAHSLATAQNKKEATENALTIVKQMIRALRIS